MDTTIPATPESVSARPLVFDKYAITLQRNAPEIAITNLTTLVLVNLAKIMLLNLGAGEDNQVVLHHMSIMMEQILMIFRFIC